jgi:hypothetical protein
VWDQSHGAREVGVVLAGLGIPLPPLLWVSCGGVSSNGRTILVHGRESNTIYPAWLAFLGDPVGGSCYANCDGSTVAPALNVNDFTCFLNRFAAGDPYANCDASTAAPVLNVNDFTCFLNAFAAGCS